MYAILRIAKHKDNGSIGASAAHNWRTRPTPNADPSLTVKNTHVGAKSPAELKVALAARLATQAKIRKNAVLAVEYMITASPEFFNEKSKADIEKYFSSAEKWLRMKHGTENVLSISRHVDETSPHLCAYIVPINPANGKLSASHFFDGPEKMSDMQTDFAQVCGYPVQLERGIEGSQAKHTTVREFYGRLNRPAPAPTTVVPKVPEPTIGQQLVEALGGETDHSRLKAQAEHAAKKRREEAVAHRKTLEAKATAYDLAVRQNAKRDAAVAALRAKSVELREVPLEAVFERLGCTVDPRDKNNWQTPVGRVTQTGDKFYAHDAKRGGGGAIDVVMVVEDLTFKDALARLGELFGTGAVVQHLAVKSKRQFEDAAKAPKPAYKPPAPVESNWPRVREYLTKTRALAASLIDSAHRVGRIYADAYANAVFVLGRQVGVELRGTGEQSFHGIRGAKEPFVISGRPGLLEVAFTESAIDALSLRDLGFNGEILGMAGTSPERSSALADQYRAKGYKVIAAHDNDKSGDKQAADLGQPVERLRPTLKDWNDDLKAQRSAGRTGLLSAYQTQGQTMPPGPDSSQSTPDQERRRASAPRP